MDREELRYWVAFARVPGVGRARVEALERYFGSLAAAWEAPASRLKDAGLDDRSIRSLLQRRATVDPQRELDGLEAMGARALTWHDAQYPPRLKEVYDRPPVLFVLGDLRPEDERSVAVVGTRRPTAYGRQVAHQLAYDLAGAGVTVVSGLARGVDAAAHRAALEAGGRTIAVLGCGLDVVYPREHADLARRVARHGALVTEHPLGTRPDARNFPRRNRIMSGMTLGTVVVEAGEASGALITARHALEQDREVFAVPGSVFSPVSRGTNRLIQEGAKLVIDYKDVLEELNLSSVGQQLELRALFPVDEGEAEVLRYVTFDPIHIDEVVRSSGKDIAQVSSALALMELKGLVKQVGSMHYVRLREAPAQYQTTQ